MEDYTYTEQKKAHSKQGGGMNMIDLDELMRLHEAATPGPWEVKIGDFESEDGYGTVTAPYVEAACNAVPELVARIRGLESQLCAQNFKQVSALEPCRIVSNNNSTPPKWLMRRFTEVK